MRDTIPADLLAAIRDQRLREQAATMRLAPNHWPIDLPAPSRRASDDLFGRWLDGIERLGYKALPAATLRWMTPKCQPFGVAEPRMPRLDGGVMWASPQLPPQWSATRVARGGQPVRLRPATLRRIAEGLRRFETVQPSVPWVGVQVADILTAQKFD